MTTTTATTALFARFRQLRQDYDSFSPEYITPELQEAWVCADTLKFQLSILEKQLGERKQSLSSLYSTIENEVTPPPSPFAKVNVSKCEFIYDTGVIEKDYRKYLQQIMYQLKSIQTLLYGKPLEGEYRDQDAIGLVNLMITDNAKHQDTLDINSRHFGGGGGGGGGQMIVEDSEEEEEEEAGPAM